MKKLIINSFIIFASISSSFGQALIFSQIGGLRNFYTTKGKASEAQSFGVASSNLTNNIIINAPDRFELSTEPKFNNPQKTLEYPPYIGPGITLYIRFNPTLNLSTGETHITISSKGAQTLSAFLYGAVNAYPNNIFTLSANISTNHLTSDYIRGRNITSSCKTSVNDTNTIDAIFTFIADNSNTSLDLTVGNPTWLSTMELLDTLTFAPISNTCQSNVGVGQSTRNYSFTGLTVGKKYLVRLELGDVSPLGHARMEAANNTFSVKLNSTVTDVSDNEISSNKTISNICNLQGLEVSKDFRGLVIYKYSDGTTQKVVQE